jgi:hypothetical protein
MPVSHAPVSSRALNAAAGQERVPGLLEVLAQVADPRKRRGRRFTLAFTLAVAVVCVLAGARSFREIGDQAADLPQDILAALGGVRHAAQVIRIRRDTLDIDGAMIAKETVHAATSLDAVRGPPRPWPASPAGSGPSRPSTGSATPPTARTTAPATPATDPRSWPPSGTWPSACSASPGSPRSPAPSRHSAATAPESSTSYRYRHRPIRLCRSRA